MHRLVRAGLFSAGCVIAWNAAGAADTPHPAPVIAAPTTDAKAPPTHDQIRLATQLIDLIHPDDAMVQSNLKGWEAVSRKTAATDTVFSKLEAQYPGVTEAAIAAARPAAVEYANEFVRKSKAAKIRVFAESLTGAELRQLIDFFEQPTGQRFARRMVQSDEVADDLATKAQTSENLTQQDLNDMLRKQAKAAVKTLSADDMLAIMKFESLPVAKKFAAAGQESDRVILDIINNPDPNWIEKQNKAVADGAMQFVEAKRAGKK